MTKNVVLANCKGGVGKSTMAALLVEWLNHEKISVDIFDGDPNQTLQMWASYCQEEGRPVLSPKDNVQITIVDTAGTSGSAITWIQKADIIICPFRATFADLDATLSWFRSLNSELQEKFLFVPNMLGVASEQKNAIEDVRKLLKELKRGSLLEKGFLKNRDAIYPDILKGHSKNFFSRGSRFDPAKKEARTVAKNILERAGVLS